LYNSNTKSNSAIVDAEPRAYDGHFYDYNLEYFKHLFLHYHTLLSKSTCYAFKTSLWWIW